jgi:hypothetical protein
VRRPSVGAHCRASGRHFCIAIQLEVVLQVTAVATTYGTSTSMLVALLYSGALRLPPPEPWPRATGSLQVAGPEQSSCGLEPHGRTGHAAEVAAGADKSLSSNLNVRLRVCEHCCAVAARDVSDKSHPVGRECGVECVVRIGLRSRQGHLYYSVPRLHEKA